MTVNKEVIPTDWNKVYEDSYQSGGWTYLSRTIVRTLEIEVENISKSDFIELGCGSGRNSLRLANLGGNVTLLDLSHEVLEAAENLFRSEGKSAKFIQGNIFDIPAQDDAYDVVWNAGVIEHWVGDEQVDCIREMLRISKPDGFVVTLNPNKSSFLHYYGKRFLDLFGKYAYTDEVNIFSLNTQAEKAGGHLTQKEYSVGFFVLFVGLFIQLKSSSLFGKFAFLVFKVLNAFFTALDKSFLGGMLFKLDKLLSKIFGGYLLVSKMRKSQSNG